MESARKETSKQRKKRHRSSSKEELNCPREAEVLCKELPEPLEPDAGRISDSNSRLLHQRRGSQECTRSFNASNLFSDELDELFAEYNLG